MVGAIPGQYHLIDAPYWHCYAFVVLVKGPIEKWTIYLRLANNTAWDIHDIQRKSHDLCQQYGNLWM